MVGTAGKISAFRLKVRSGWGEHWWLARGLSGNLDVWWLATHATTK
jgi:hypothetical protein